MKKTFLFSAVAAAALLTACSQSDDVTSPGQETDNARKVAPITIRASYGNPGTRVNYDDNGSEITPSWEATDKLVVVYDGKTTELTSPSISGNVATFTGEISYTSTAPVKGTTDLVCYVAHSGVSITTSGANAAYTGQNGTLRGASIIYKGTGKYNTTAPNNFSFTAENTILKFTVNGMESGAATLTYKCDDATVASASITANGSEQVVYMAVPAGSQGNKQELEYNGNVETLGTSAKSLTAGQSYAKSVTFTAAAPEFVSGDFTVDASGKKVKFSKGNLQATYDGSSWTWAFAEHQWDYIGDAAGNTSINGNGTVSASNVTVDLFGWVGESSSWTGAAMYGISNEIRVNRPDTYGNITSDALKSDWGALAISNGGNAANSGWRTLTGGATGEWNYIFNTRTTISGIRYAKATVNGVSGVILLPDNWNSDYYTIVSANTSDVDFTKNSISKSNWINNFESHGCVFLPAAGDRTGSKVYYAGSSGVYWSSSPGSSYTTDANCVIFNSDDLYPSWDLLRDYGMSVRLVRDVE